MIMVKGDWAGFAVTFGFPTGAHHANPCFLCDASGGPDGTWRETEGVSMFSSPWHAKTFEMYDAACRACESHVRIKTTDDWQVFLGHVHTSRRRERGGQITTTDIPALGIAKNLRVDSSPTCRSSLKLEEFAASFPPAGVDITLWNPSAETLARHRNPLFGIDLRYEYLLPDELHTMHLGVFQIFVHTVLWDLIICDAARLKAWVCKNPMQLEVFGWSTR